MITHYCHLWALRNMMLISRLETILGQFFEVLVLDLEGYVI